MHFLETIKNKALNTNVQYEILLFLFFLYIPFLGEGGYKLFMSIPYYYTWANIITMCMCFIAYSKEKRNLENIFHVNRAFILYFVFNVIIVFFMMCVSNVNFDRFIFTATFLMYPWVLSEKGITDETLKGVGVLSLIVFIFSAFYSLELPENYNINTYSYVMTYAAVLSLLMVVTVKSNIIKVMYATVVLGVCAALVQVQYLCDTQMYACIIIYVLYLFKYFFKYRGFSTVTFTVFFGAMVLVPVITVILLDNGIVDNTIFSYRGRQWCLAIKYMFEAGSFNVTYLPTLAHSGVLDIGMKLSLEGMILLVGSMYFMCLYLIWKLKKNEYNSMIIIALLFYCLINITESYLYSISLCGFTIFLFGLLMGRSKNENIKDIVVPNKFITHSAIS